MTVELMFYPPLGGRSISLGLFEVDKIDRSPEHSDAACGILLVVL